MLAYTNVVVPSNAKYVQITWFNDAAISEGIYSGSVADFEIRVRDPQAIQSSTSISNTIVFTSGSAINAKTGSTMSSSVMSASNYVDITSIQSMQMQFMTWTSSTGSAASFGYAFYDENKAFLVGQAFPLADSSLGNSSGTSYSLKIDAIPMKAAYLRTTYPSDTSTYGAFSITANEIA